MTVKFEIPSRKEVSRLLRKNDSRLNTIAENNDRAWETLSNPVTEIIGLLSDTVNLQSEIKEKEEIFKKKKNEILAIVKNNEGAFKDLISYDEYGNMTISFKRETLKELYPVLGVDVVLTIFENIIAKDKKAQMKVVSILKEFGHDYNEFVTISPYKISAVLKDMKLNEKNMKPNEKEAFERLFDLVDENTVIRLIVE